MKSTRPIRALMRGLDALTVLNTRDGATVSDIAQEIRLPRTTVYRILETLCNSKFVFRDAADDKYRLTLLVLSLSEGFHDEAWVKRLAKPQIEDLCREIVWPLSLETLSGTAMMARETTDHSTPLAMERYLAGTRSALLTSAAGRAYLAFCPALQRETLLDLLARSGKDEDKAARAPRPDVQRMLSDIKLQGYAVTIRTRRLIEEVSLSVPMLQQDHVLGVLTVRFGSSAIAQKVALDRFLPKLRQCAAKIITLVSAA